LTALVTLYKGPISGTFCKAVQLLNIWRTVVALVVSRFGIVINDVQPLNIVSIDVAAEQLMSGIVCNDVQL
jgi:hypothetical protein